MIEKLSRYFPPNADVLDFGAGIGTLAVLRHQLSGRRPDCLEIDPRLREVVRQRGFRCFDSLQAAAPAYDGVYTSNVLEHIEDDVGALQDLRRVLRRGAHIAVYVPAFMCLYSDMDRAIGHFRRYSRRELSGKLARAGFTVVEHYYDDCLGFFASATLRLLRRTWRECQAERGFGFYGACVYPVSKVLDELGGRHLFGKNLLAVGRNDG